MTRSNGGPPTLQALRPRGRTELERHGGAAPCPHPAPPDARDPLQPGLPLEELSQLPCLPHMLSPSPPREANTNPPGRRGAAGPSLPAPAFGRPGPGGSCRGGPRRWSRARGSQSPGGTARAPAGGGNAAKTPPSSATEKQPGQTRNLQGRLRCSSAPCPPLAQSVPLGRAPLQIPAASATHPTSLRPFGDSHQPSCPRCC